MGFAFRTASQIVFGAGESRRAPELVAQLGRRVLFVTGVRSLERSGTMGELQDGLSGRDLAITRCTVPGEPDVALVDAATRTCRDTGCDVVLAVGGGSVIDAGKAVAALATNEGSALDYLEVVGSGRQIERAPLPVIAVPTTAGSGSEVTRNSVLRVPDAGVKRSLRSDLLLPRIAIVDPTLAATAPRSVAAAAGMDAMSHLIEAYVSRAAQPTTDALALSGMRLAVQALRTLAADRATSATHEAMALASLWGGIALANAGLGAVHGLAAPIGGRCSIAHGVVCACLLPATLRVNIAALQARDANGPALGRYRNVARLLAGEDSNLDAAAHALQDLRQQLGVPSLASLNLGPGDQNAIVSASTGGSMRNNPIELTENEIDQILTSALHDKA